MSECYQRDAKTVNGYVRNQPLDIPPEISKIILLYYYILREIIPFDPEFIATEVELLDDKKSCFLM